MLEVLKMLKPLKSGKVFYEEEISEMTNNLRDWDKELEHKIEPSYFETLKSRNVDELEELI